MSSLKEMMRRPDVQETQGILVFSEAFGDITLDLSILGKCESSSKGTAILTELFSHC